MSTRLRKLPLQYKILCLTVAMVCFVLALAGILVTRHIMQHVQDNMAKRALDIGRVVARVPAVQNAILSDNPSEVLQPFAERWRFATGAAFIVISNMNEIRLSHPLPEKVGTPMADLYREPVLKGQEYVYVGQGSLAPSLRANVPIYDLSGERQIGFVSVGFYLTDIYRMALGSIKQVFYALLVALGFSVAGAIYVARDVKKSIFGLEPYEIATILKERVATLEAIREGVVAVDTAGRIRVINRQAALLLGLSPEEAIGHPIRDILPQNNLDTVIRTGQAVYDEEQRVNEIAILANSVPIIVDNRVVGAVISFRDRTEVSRLAEELTGVHRFVEVLRAQTHEFKNKLHAISGLIQLGRYDEAVDFITGNAANTEEMFKHLCGTIKDSVTFGLLLGKSSRIRELGIEFQITPDTFLSKLPNRFTGGDMVLLLGNLLENAIEAVSEAEHKSITLGIVEEANGLHVEVTNSGLWIPEELSEKIYQRGFTTKGGSRGLGLALVAEKVEKMGGYLTHWNLPDGGVTFYAFIPY